MILCKSASGEILWSHEDDNLKTQEPYKSDENVFIVNGEISYPKIPDDKYIYKYIWNEEKQEVCLLNEGLKPVSMSDMISTISDTTNIISEDILSTIELEVDTNDKVLTSQDDNLLNMEMLIALQEQMELIQNLLRQRIND